MPARNGTGPLGQGPFTGRRRGFCRFSPQQAPDQAQQAFPEEKGADSRAPQGAVYNAPQNGGFPFPFFGRGRGFFCRGGRGGCGGGGGRGRGGFGRFGG